MPEQTLFMLSPQELTEALIKHHAIHRGAWALAVEFELTAENALVDDEEIVPAALVRVRRIGIDRVERPNAFSIDAAVANPAAHR